MANQRRNIFTRTRLNRQQSNLMRVPAIICYYAKNGRWPEYNKNLRRLVQRLAIVVFSMSDESVKFYCTQVFQLNQFFRPLAGQIPATIPTRRSLPQTTSTNFAVQTFRPTIFTFPSTPATTIRTTQSSSTIRTTQFTSTLATTASTNGVTATVAPSASASGTGTGKRYQFG